MMLNAWNKPKAATVKRVRTRHFLVAMCLAVGVMTIFRQAFLDVEPSSDGDMVILAAAMLLQGQDGMWALERIAVSPSRSHDQRSQVARAARTLFQDSMPIALRPGVSVSSVQQ